MDKATRERALRLLSEKKSDPGITHSDIEVETGYSRRQLIRLSKRLDEDGADTILVHGNVGARPHNAAAEDEVRVLRESAFEIKNSRSTCGCITFSGNAHYPDQGRSGTGAPLSLPRRKLPSRMPL